MGLMDRDEIEDGHRKRAGYVRRGEAGENGGWNERRLLLEEDDDGVPDSLTLVAVGACWTGEPPGDG